MTVPESQWNDLSDYREGNYLEHYGRLGMKWGQHIFGKDKESSGSKTKSSSTKKNGIRQRIQKRSAEKKEQAEAKKAETAAKKAEKAAQQAVKKRESILRSPTKLYKNRYDLTQDEINSALKRFEWEKKLRDYSNSEMEAGKKYLDMAFQYTNSAINLYNSAARVVNSFDLSEKPWSYVESANPEKKKDGNKKK